MGNKNNMPIKVSSIGYNFLFDLQTNIRLKLKSTNQKRTEIGMSKTLEIIANYFKLNNDRYLELIKLYEEKK